MTKPLPTVPVHAIDPQPDAPQWLVRDLWTTAAVGVIGGSPKVGKSWFGLDLAVSVGKHSVYSRQVKPGKGGKCEIGIRNLS